MKKEWQKKALGELCDVIGGGTPSKEKSVFYSGHIPWATVRDMRQDPITETEFRITKDAVKSSSTNIIPSGSVVIATRVGLGKVCILGQDTAINQDLRGIIPRNEDNLEVRYLYWWFKSITDVIIAEGTGATVQGVRLPFVKSLLIPFPPLEEQKRIIAKLDEAFVGLAKAKENAEKNLLNARALFESHLESVFTQRGTGWVEKKLEEIGKTQTGSTPSTSDQSNYGDFISFVKPGNFNTDGTLDYDKDGLSERGAGGARIVPGGSVLMVCIGATIGKCGYCDQDVTTNQQVNALTPCDGSSNRFIYYQMRTKIFQRKVIHASGQATLPIINKSKWSALSVWLTPHASEQKIIVAKLDVMLTETQRLARLYEQKLEALESLKKSILHEAFSGNI